MNSVRVLPLLLLPACAACGNVGTPPQPQFFNLEVTGSAACLGAVASTLDDLHVGVAKMPVWQGPVGKMGAVGAMEVGPIEAAQVPAISRFIAAARCVVHIERRPCATPSSDVKRC